MLVTRSQVAPWFSVLIYNDRKPTFQLEIDEEFVVLFLKCIDIMEWMEGYLSSVAWSRF